MIRGVAAGAALLVLAAGCTGDGEAEPTPEPLPSAAATRDPVVPPPPPEVDSCHRLDYPQVLEPTVDGRSVPCQRPHTARTIKVGKLDTTFAGHALAVDAQRVRSQPTRKCLDALASYVGGSVQQRRLSMLSVVAFAPTVEAADAGERWFRCDVVAVVAPEELGRLPRGLQGLLGTEAGRNQFGMCGTARPGTTAFTRVACSRPHAWRAVSTVDVRPGPKGRWPGREAAEAAGQEPCAEAARERADDALNYQWGYEWPTKEQWRAGRRHGICWAPD